jgi:hypothetical protein
VKQVFGFVLDVMHIVGGGAAKYAFQFMFGLGKKGIVRLEPPSTLGKMNDYIQAWSQRTPKEMARDVRSFQEMDKWKMRESHECLNYHSVALFGVEEHREAVGEDLVEAFMGFVVAMHLICQKTHECPSPRDFQVADELLKRYVDTFVDEFSPKFLTYKNHCLVHLSGEAEAYQSHLGGLDAFPFENFLSIFRRHLIRTGKGVIEQCYNRLIELAHHTLPRDSSGNIREFEITEESQVQAMLKVGTLDLPAETVVRVELDRAKKFIQFKGFEISCR